MSGRTPEPVDLGELVRCLERVIDYLREDVDKTPGDVLVAVAYLDRIVSGLRLRGRASLPEGWPP